MTARLGVVDGGLVYPETARALVAAELDREVEALLDRAALEGHGPTQHHLERTLP